MTVVRISTNVGDAPALRLHWSSCSVHNGGTIEVVAIFGDEFKKVANEWERTKDLCKKLIEVWLLRYNRCHRDVRVRASGRMNGRVKVSGGSMTGRSVKRGISPRGGRNLG